MKTFRGRPEVPTNRHRRGGIMVLVLVCVVVISGVIGNMLRNVTVHGRQLRALQKTQQVRYLCLAGRDRAERLLQSDSEYRGETWTIDGPELGGMKGQVLIRVENDGSAGRIVVTAQMGTSAAERVRMTDSWRVVESGE